MPNSGADLALVTIDVLDVNDNPPVFQNVHTDPIVLHEVSHKNQIQFNYLSISFSVVNTIMSFCLQNTPVSTVIYTFYTTDADEGSNGLVTYELVSPVSIVVFCLYKNIIPCSIYSLLVSLTLFVCSAILLFFLLRLTVHSLWVVSVEWCTLPAL